MNSGLLQVKWLKTPWWLLGFRLLKTPFWAVISVETDRRFHGYLARLGSYINHLQCRISVYQHFRICYLLTIGMVIVDLLKFILIFTFKRYGDFTFESAFVLFSQRENLAVVFICTSITACQMTHLISKYQYSVSRVLKCCLVTAQLR